MTTNQTIDGVPLLPCPFCGGEPYGTHDHYVHDDLSPMPCVECRACSAHLKAEDWNRRAEPAAQPQGEPVAWANWKVGSRSYVPYRTAGEARRCVEASEISATQNGPYRVVPLYAEQPAPVAVVPELTSELRWILGQMCFQHIHTAQAPRLMGHEIARKAEDEQAVTIYWMLGHYLKDAANWRQNATAELKASAPAV